MKINSLYVGALSVDLTTGNVSAVVQQPVYSSSNKLVGVAGVDLQLNKIADMIEDINFNNKGFGFLLDNQQKVVHLSNKTQHQLSITDESERGKEGLDALESQFKNTSGFQQLNTQMKNNLNGTSIVTFKGEEYYVAYRRLQLAKPVLDWYVGLLVPMKLIEETSKTSRIYNKYGCSGYFINYCQCYFLGDTNDQ